MGRGRRERENSTNEGVITNWGKWKVNSLKTTRFCESTAGTNLKREEGDQGILHKEVKLQPKEAQEALMRMSRTHHCSYVCWAWSRGQGAQRGGQTGKVPGSLGNRSGEESRKGSGLAGLSKPQEEFLIVPWVMRTCRSVSGCRCWTEKHHTVKHTTFKCRVQQIYIFTVMSLNYHLTKSGNIFIVSKFFHIPFDSVPPHTPPCYRHIREPLFWLIIMDYFCLALVLHANGIMQYILLCLTYFHLTSCLWDSFMVLHVTEILDGFDQMTKVVIIL